MRYQTVSGWVGVRVAHGGSGGNGHRGGEHPTFILQTINWVRISGFINMRDLYVWVKGKIFKNTNCILFY